MLLQHTGGPSGSGTSGDKDSSDSADSQSGLLTAEETGLHINADSIVRGTGPRTVYTGRLLQSGAFTDCCIAVTQLSRKSGNKMYTNTIERN